MINKSNDIVIVAALRTPIGTYKGSLKGLSADKLGAVIIKEILQIIKLSPNEIDEVIMGQVLTSATGQNPARQEAIDAGVPVSIPAHIINQVCGSGLRSIVSAYQSIKLGDSNIVVAGGQESMSKAPHAIFYRDEKKLSEDKLVDTMVHDGLIDAFNNYHMGITAENVADKYKISRDEQDKFALDSQTKTQKAISENRFKEEMIKLPIKIDGTVTAGNSSGLNDGAAATVLMNRAEAEKRSIKPIAKIISWATCGVDPSLMGLGPIPAVRMALDRAKWKIDDVDLFEINEAFASQSIAVIKDLKIPKEIVNVNGGAIALGHPIGASGTRIVVTLIHEMLKRGSSKGCATLCIGGGMGIAMCIEKD